MVDVAEALVVVEDEEELVVESEDEVEDGVVADEEEMIEDIDVEDEETETVEEDCVD